MNIFILLLRLFFTYIFYICVNAFYMHKLNVTHFYITNKLINYG